MTTEIINSNPKVLEQWELPQRKEESAKPAFELGDLAGFSLFSTNPVAGGPQVPFGLDETPDLINDSEVEPVDAQEIYDLIATISDPEHPLTLGQLAIVGLDRIYIEDNGNPDDIASVHIQITPTVTHCGLSTLIGLGIRVRLERSLPPRYRVRISITPGTHQSESQVNKQLNDKERVAAACENDQLLKVISGMLETCA